MHVPRLAFAPAVVLAVWLAALVAPAAGQTPYRVDDINPGAGNGVSSFFTSPLTPLGADSAGGFVFRATDGTDGELWVTDGSEAGTQRVADLNPAASSNPDRFFPFGTEVLFRATGSAEGRELWITDGTAAGTALVLDIRPGSDSSNPFFGAQLGGEVYFSARGATDGTELWKTDGTAGGTVQVADINPGAASSSPNSIVEANGLVFFQATNGSDGFELFRSDGTAAGTQQVVDLNPGSSSGVSAPIATLGGEVFFRGNDGLTGRELWKSDGTTTVQIADINPGAANSISTDFSVVGGHLYFLADDGVTGIELWRTDGSVGNAERVTDVNPAGLGVSIGPFCGAGGNIVFIGDDGTNGAELWVTDGTPDNETLLVEIDPGPGSGVELQSLRCIGDRVFFAGTDGGTSFGTEPWVSDGTVAGTARLADIAPGTASSVSFAPGFVLADGRVYFPANDGTTGYELWALELGGTPAPVPALTALGTLGLGLALAATGAAFVRRDRHGRFCPHRSLDWTER